MHYKRPTFYTVWITREMVKFASQMVCILDYWFTMMQLRNFEIESFATKVSRQHACHMQHMPSRDNTLLRTLFWTNNYNPAFVEKVFEPGSTRKIRLETFCILWKVDIFNIYRKKPSESFQGQKTQILPIRISLIATNW